MNREPRPIVSALIFVLGALVVGAALHWTSDRLAPVYRPSQIRMQLLEQRAAEIEIISAGNSLNRAFDFRHMDLRGFHLWDGGADLLDTAYALRILTPMLPNLEVVLVPLNPLSFRTDKTLIGLDGLRRQYYAVMPTLASWRPLPGDAGNLIRGKLSSIVREDHWQQVFRAAFTEENERERSRRDRGVDETGYYLPYLARTIEPGRQRVEELEDFFDESERLVRANPGLPEKIYREFAAAIRKIRARGIRVILILPPNLEPVNDLFARHPLETAELDEFIARLRNDHGVESLDFSTDAAFSNRPEWFFTEDHLNMFGAAVFSRILSDLLPQTAEGRVQIRAGWKRNQPIEQQQTVAAGESRRGSPTGTRGDPPNAGELAARRRGRGARIPASARDVPPASLPLEGWAVETAEGNVASLVSSRADNWMRVSIDRLANRSPSSIRLGKGPVPVTRGHRYVLTFWMRADAARPVTCGISSAADAKILLGTSTTVDAGTWWQEFSCAFNATATEAGARIFFDVGTSPTALELSRVELRDLSTGTVVMSTDPAWKPPPSRVR